MTSTSRMETTTKVTVISPNDDGTLSVSGIFTLTIADPDEAIAYLKANSFIEAGDTWLFGS